MRILMPSAPADAGHRLPVNLMAFEVVDPSEFVSDGHFTEDSFLAAMADHDWSKYSGQKVLVRGCSLIIPPWAYMYLTAKLMPVAHSIRYGNEHDNIVVFRQKKG